MVLASGNGDYFVFQLAVTHGFGGPHSSEKAQWMVGVIEDYFKDNSEYISSIFTYCFIRPLGCRHLSRLADGISLAQNGFNYCQQCLLSSFARLISRTNCFQPPFLMSADGFSSSFTFVRL